MASRSKKILLFLAGVVAAAALIVWLVEAQARRDDARLARLHLERGMNLYHQKAYIKAEGELRRALRADPQEWKAPFYVGAVQIERGRYEMAIPYLERALTLNPLEPKILNALGVAYFKNGRLDMAKGYFTASLDLDPANSDAQGLLETMAKLQWKARQAAESKER